MSWRLLVLLLACACGSAEVGPNEPQTAKQKQLEEAKESGELDKPTTKWAGWRYTGTRSECFYVVGRRCFKTEKLACAAAHCKAGKCSSTGAGPATTTCSK
jgi:hypothetical protein